MKARSEYDGSQKAESGLEEKTGSKADLFPDLVEQRLIDDIDQPPLSKIRQRWLDRLR